MSASYGPCPKCGEQTVYVDRGPSPCWKCVVVDRGPEKIRRIDEAIQRAMIHGNRKNRRAAKKGKS